MQGSISAKLTGDPRRYVYPLLRGTSDWNDNFSPRSQASGATPCSVVRVMSTAAKVLHDYSLGADGGEGKRPRGPKILGQSIVA